MATRSNNRNRYFVRLSRGREFKLSAAEWDELCAGGWIESDAPGSRYGELRHGVIAWVRGCDLHLLAADRIKTACASWARAWLFRDGLVEGSAAGEPWYNRWERVMREMEEALWIDAFLWQKSRDKKARGVNSFAWIDAETKAEIFRAFGLEMKSPPGDGGLLVGDGVGMAA